MNETLSVVPKTTETDICDFRKSALSKELSFTKDNYDQAIAVLDSCVRFEDHCEWVSGSALYLLKEWGKQCNVSWTEVKEKLPWSDSKIADRIRLFKKYPTQDAFAAAIKKHGTVTKILARLRADNGNKPRGKHRTRTVPVEAKKVDQPPQEPTTIPAQPSNSPALDHTAMEASNPLDLVDKANEATSEHDKPRVWELPVQDGDTGTMPEVPPSVVDDEDWAVEPDDDEEWGDGPGTDVEDPDKEEDVEELLDISFRHLDGVRGATTLADAKQAANLLKRCLLRLAEALGVDA
jgi:hypothetical protein